MYKKYTKLGLFRLLLIISLSLIFLIVLNFTSGYFLLKSLLILVIMFFLPGYFLINILFKKRPETSEFFVLSVGISIGIFILVAMGIHFAGVRINVLNILNLVIIASLILGLLDSFKNDLLTRKV